MRPSRFPGPLAPLILSILLAVAACSSPDWTPDWAPDSACIVAFESARYAEAVSLCKQEFEQNGSAEAGYAAARAAFFSGDEDTALSWVERLAGSDLEARTLILAATIHQQRGDASRERDALETSLPLLRAQEDWGRASWGLYSLAYKAWEESRYREALAQAREAEELAQRSPNGEILRLAGELQYSVLYAVGDLRGARRALDRARPHLSAQTPLDRARWHHHEASLLLDSDRPHLAREAETRALELAELAETVEPRLLRSAHLNLVEIALRLEDPEGARRHLEAAWHHLGEATDRSALLFYKARVARRTGDSATAVESLRSALAEDPVADWSWELELDLGTALEDLGDLRGAEEAYRRSVEGVEALRTSLSLEDLKPWLLERKRRPFEALFRLLVLQDRDLEALEVSERARARNLLDALVRGLEGDEGAPGPGSEAEDRLASLENWLPLAGQRPPPLNPGQSLLEAVEGSNVLLFFEAQDQVWRLTLEGSQPRWRPLPWSVKELEKAVDAFLVDLDDGPAATELGNVLLPRRALPEASGDLYLLPDGPLNRLPFAALRVGQKSLLARHSLTYLPSLTTTTAKKMSSKRTHQRSFQEGAGTLVIGDPLGDLPAARREAVDVAALLGSGELALGENASLESLAGAGPLDLLHLATHTGLGATGPWITLAHGVVPANQVLSASGAPRLAVLATCASATRPGRELWGSLAAVFLAAGSSAVLATQRSVEDAQARELVLRFYREGGRSQPARALARAQRSLAVEGSPPSAWAPYLILGNSIHGGAD